MHPRSFLLIPALLLCFPMVSIASPADDAGFFRYQTWTIPGALPDDGIPAPSRRERIWRVNFIPAASAALDAGAAMPAAAMPAAEQRPMAFEYSDGYNMRRKIHMAASWATVPLFVAQYLVGQDLYDGAGENARSAHGALTAGIAALFVVNTVTGVWNLWEGRKDPNGRTRRLVHGIAMLGANLGFVATGAMAPDDDDEGGGGGGSASSHRAMALTSMGVAAASYIYMLVTR